MRLGRAQPGLSRLRPPVVIGAAVTFRPLKITLSVEIVARTSQPPQREVHSTLRPPAVVGPSVTFRPLETTLAAASRLSRTPHPRDLTPAAVGPSVTFGPVTVKLVRTPRQPYATHPALRPPAVVGAATVFRPLLVRLAPSSRLGRITRNFRTPLPPPAVVVSPSLPIPTRIVLAAASRLARITHSRIKLPIIGAAVTFPSVAVRLAQSTRLGRHARSFRTAVPPPTVVVQSLPLSTRIVLATTSRIARVTDSRLRAPAAVGAAVTPPTLEQIRTRVWLTRRGQQRFVYPRVRPPAAVSRPVLAEQRRVRIVLAPAPKQARGTHWELRPPAVITPGIAFTIGFYDSPTPDSGSFGASSATAPFDQPSPSDTRFGSHPAGGQFDRPSPSQVES